MQETYDYITSLFLIPKVLPKTVLSGFFLTFMRIAPIIALAPFLGSKLSSIIKVGLGLSFTAILLPKALATLSGPIYFDHTFILYAIKELVLGFFLGFIISIPFFIAQSSGNLIDFMRGSSSLMVTDPFSQTQNSPLSLLYNYTLIVLFYKIGGMAQVIDGVLNTFSVIPLDQIIPSIFFNQANSFWVLAFSALNKIIALSIQFAAPPILAILMTELFLGISNRLAPNVQISFLGMSLKSLVGLGFLALSWTMIATRLGDKMQEVLNGFISLTKTFT